MKAESNNNRKTATSFTTHVFASVSLCVSIDSVPHRPQSVRWQLSERKMPKLSIYRSNTHWQRAKNVADGVSHQIIFGGTSRIINWKSMPIAMCMCSSCSLCQWRWCAWIVNRNNAFIQRRTASHSNNANTVCHTNTTHLRFHKRRCLVSRMNTCFAHTLQATHDSFYFIANSKWSSSASESLNAFALLANSNPSMSVEPNNNFDSIPFQFTCSVDRVREQVRRARTKRRDESARTSLFASSHLRPQCETIQYWRRFGCLWEIDSLIPLASQWTHESKISLQCEHGLLINWVDINLCLVFVFVFVHPLVLPFHSSSCLYFSLSLSLSHPLCLRLRNTQDQIQLNIMS